MQGKNLTFFHIAAIVKENDGIGFLFSPLNFLFHVSKWLNQIQVISYSEMLSHRFITPNHKVQETVFADGKKVVVNFSDSPYLFEGRTIREKGFITIE